MVKIVRRVGPWHARLGRGDPVADRVVGVGVRIGGVHVGHGPRQLASVVVGVGYGVRRGVGASRTGHGGAPPDGVVHIAVCGDCSILHLRYEVAVCLVAPCAGDAVRTGHLADEVAICQAGIAETARRDGDPVHATVCVEPIRVVGDVVDRQTLFFTQKASGRVGASQRLGIQPRDGLRHLVQSGVVGERPRPDRVRHLRKLPDTVVGIGDVRRGIGVVDPRHLAEQVVRIGRHKVVALRVLPRPGAGRGLPVRRVGVGRAVSIRVELRRDKPRGRVVCPRRRVALRGGIGPGFAVPGCPRAEGGHRHLLPVLVTISSCFDYMILTINILFIWSKIKVGNVIMMTFVLSIPFFENFPISLGLIFHL